MAKASVAYSNLQYEDYANWYLKAYEPFTTNPKVIFESKSETAVSFSKVQLDPEGFPISTGGTRFIPFIDGFYDLWLFPTAKEADQNDTSNAIRMAKNITAESLLENAQTASYSNTGVVGLIDDTQVDAIYDVIDGGGTPILPPIYELPDFNAIMQMITRQAGGGAEEAIGDGKFTLNNLPAAQYVPEKIPFVRADYPDLDTLMGAYIPEDFDFTSATFIETDINEGDFSITPDNLNINRSYGLYNGKIFLLRKEKLYILNKDTLAIEQTINVDVTEDFIRAEVIHGDLVIATGKRTAPVDITLYTLDVDMMGITSKIVFDGWNDDNYQDFVLLEGNDTDVYLCATKKYKTATPPSSTLLDTIVVVKTDTTYADFAATYLITDSAYIDGNTFTQKSMCVFYSKTTDELKFLYKSSGGTNSDKNPIMISMPKSELSTTVGVYFSYILPEAFHKRLPNIPFVFLEDNFGEMNWSTNIANYQFMYNQEENTLNLFSNALNQKDSGASVISDSEILTIKYDLNNNTVTSAATTKNARIATADVNLDLQHSFGGTPFYIGTRPEQRFLVGNKEYNVLNVRKDNIPQVGLMWISMEGESVGEIDISLFYMQNEGSNTGGFYGTYDQRVLIENNEDLYWMAGLGYTNPEVRKVKKLTLIDNTIVNTTRPAPILNAVPPMKGFIRAK